MSEAPTPLVPPNAPQPTAASSSCPTVGTPGQSIFIPDDVDSDDWKAAYRAACDCFTPADQLVNLARFGPEGNGVNWTGQDGSNLQGATALERGLHDWLDALNRALHVSGYYDVCWDRRGKCKTGLSARFVEYAERVQAATVRIVDGFNDSDSRRVLLQQLWAFKRENTTLFVRWFVTPQIEGWPNPDEPPDPDEPRQLSPEAQLREAIKIARAALDFVEESQTNFRGFYDWDAEVSEVRTLWNKLFPIDTPARTSTKCESYAEASSDLDAILWQLEAVEAKQVTPPAGGPEPAATAPSASRLAGGVQAPAPSVISAADNADPLNQLCAILRHEALPPLQFYAADETRIDYLILRTDGLIPDVARMPGAMIQVTQPALEVLSQLKAAGTYADAASWYSLIRDAHLEQLAAFAELQKIDSSPLHTMIAAPNLDNLCKAEALIQRLHQIGVIALAEAGAGVQPPTPATAAAPSPPTDPCTHGLLLLADYQRRGEKPTVSALAKLLGVSRQALHDNKEFLPLRDMGKKLFALFEKKTGKGDWQGPRGNKDKDGNVEAEDMDEEPIEDKAVD